MRKGQRYERYTKGYVQDTYWDDLKFPAQGIQIGGFATPPDRETDTGLLLFDGTAQVETIGILAQLPHAWKEGTSIKPHVHWSKTSDAAGGVVWTLRYAWWNNNEIQPSWSSLIQATDVFTIGATQHTQISTFGSIDGTGKTLSSLFLCQLGRLYNDAGDTYGADARLYEFDIHIQLDGLGSDDEFTK